MKNKITDSTDSPGGSPGSISSKDSPAEVTELLRAWGQGDSGILDELIPLVYDELRQRARRYLGQERSNHTLQPTALVHDVYCRLVKSTPDVEWENRSHFFAIASRGMRQILVEYARGKASAKRGGDCSKISLEDVGEIAVSRPEDLVALDDGLEALAAMDPDKAKLVELRFFGGLTLEAAAEAMGYSHATASREWRVARAWMYREMKGHESDD